MPLQATSGAASYDAFGGGVAAVPNYIEDAFSCFLYTGNGSTQTINNGIDLAGKGGLVWIKDRTDTPFHVLTDTTRGVNSQLYTNSTASANSNTFGVTAFNSNGFNIGSWTFVNTASDNLVSWTFREQPKFFDVVTYTGNSATQNIAHNLGSDPGCIIVKRTDADGDWFVYHRSVGNTSFTRLNLTQAAQTSSSIWNSTTPTSTQFSVGSAATNISGATYVAYLFAHNAGGFGLTGTDNVISCGSYTGNGSSSGPVINLGYEPQFIIMKAASGGTSGSQDWNMIDNMRGWTTSSNQQLNPNLAAAETSQNNIALNATGFQLVTAGSDFNGSGNTYIYIAIRRGPMKVPTTGTSVYTSASRTGTAGVIPRWSAGFPVDWALRQSNVTTGGSDWQAGDRLRGAVQLKPNLTEAEEAASPLYTFDSMTGYSSLGIAGSNTADRSWMFRRAPGFFDEVCYTGNSAASNNQNHNLGVVPEMCILKARSGVFAVDNWQVVHKNDGVTAKTTALNLTNATLVDSVMSANFTSTFFKTADATWPFTRANFNGDNYVAYLFASCPGVSRVGSYTGTGTTQVINCGFTAGSRFIMIKRTDSTGDWYVWDSARGIVAGNDPYLLLNSTAAEVASTDFIDTAATGFEISSTAPAAINASGGTFIFLAIA